MLLESAVVSIDICDEFELGVFNGRLGSGRKKEAFEEKPRDEFDEVGTFASHFGNLG